MKLSEMAEKVSKVSGTDAVTARKVIRALFQSVAEDIGAQERTAIQGFGSFIKRKMKDGEEQRILFKPAPASEAKAEKKPAARGK
jgi:nucleoid DNA-binding protein